MTYLASWPVVAILYFFNLDELVSDITLLQEHGTTYCCNVDEILC